MPDLHTQILDILANHGPQSKYDIQDKLQLKSADPFTRISTSITSLVRQGKIERCGTGVYRIKKTFESNQKTLF